MYQEKIQYFINQHRSGKLSFCKNGFFIFLGVTLVSISLQLFLVKNYVIDGGIVGISIIFSHITSIKVSWLILIFNTPFLFIGYYFLGKKFLLLSLFAIFILAMETYFLEPFPVLTTNPILVIILGGIILGMGVGVIIRFGGSLDGSEIMAILLSQRSSISIGQYVMIINFFIFSSSIFVFGIKEALYSLATYLIAYKTIDFSIRND